MSDENQAPLTEEQAKEHEEAFMSGIVDESKEESTLLAGKFKTPEELEKSYLELQKKLGAPKEEKPKPEEKPQEVPDDANATLGKREEAEAPDGPSLDEYLLELARTGAELTDEIRTDMKTRYNLTDNTISTLHTSAIDLYSSDVKNIIETAGGQESFEAMNKFVVENYTDAQIEALNFAISNKATREFTIKGLLAEAKVGDQQASTNNQPDPTHNLSAGGVQPYKTDRELQEAMSDERYVNAGHPDHDRFVKEVQGRYAVSRQYIG